MNDEWDGDALFAEGFDAALLGVGVQFTDAVAVYDYAKCVEILMQNGKMSQEDAMEFMEFNVCGAFLGKNTPVFLKEHAPIAPVAWGMPDADGVIVDLICPEEHDAHEGKYTVPLYTRP